MTTAASTEDGGDTCPFYRLINTLTDLHKHTHTCMQALCSTAEHCLSPVVTPPQPLVLESPSISPRLISMMISTPLQNNHSYNLPCAPQRKKQFAVLKPKGARQRSRFVLNLILACPPNGGDGGDDENKGDNHQHTDEK